MRRISLIIAAIGVLCSCNKELNLPAGNYVGDFQGDVVEQNTGIPSGKHHNSTNVAIVISNVTETSIDINGIVLDKRGNIIEGVVYVSDDYVIQPVISGTITKEKKSYRIEGVYKARLSPYWQSEYDVFGGYVGGNFLIE